MSRDADTGDSLATPAIIEDLFLTNTFLIKGRLANKYHRLTKMLEDTEQTFLTIEDALMVPVRGGRVVETPRVLVNREELLLAHEFVATSGDDAQRMLADNDKPVPIRAFYSGPMQLEISGQVEPGAYEPSANMGRRYFIVQQPKIRGLDSRLVPGLQVLDGLPYAILRKSKLSYIYDLG